MVPPNPDNNPPPRPTSGWERASKKREARKAAKGNTESSNGKWRKKMAKEKGIPPVRPTFRCLAPGLSDATSPTKTLSPVPGTPGMVSNETGSKETKKPKTGSKETCERKGNPPQSSPPSGAWHRACPTQPPRPKLSPRVPGTPGMVSNETGSNETKKPRTGSKETCERKGNPLQSDPPSGAWHRACPLQPPRPKLSPRCQAPREW